MRKLIKSIREYLGLSQTEFADKIGVTFATVNRWENGRAIPTKLAQSTLYEYCKEHGVPVYQMILEKIKADADAVSLDGDRILLYHGSKSGIVGEIAPKSREMCDFGKGFYMGTDPGQPLTLICDFEKSKFYVVSVDMKNLDTILTGQCSLPTIAAEWNRSKARRFMISTVRSTQEKILSSAVSQTTGCSMSSTISLPA